MFEYEDIFSLYDVDLFTLEMGQKEYLSERDNVRELVAVIKVLAQKIISSYGIDPFRVQELYKKYFESLPNSIYMWRFKLFILTLYPQYFKEELKHEFFRVFEYEKPWIFTNGAEYEQALQKGFHVLGEDKDKYIEQVVSHFGKKGDERYKMIGSDILSSILCELNEPQKQTAQLEGLKLKSEYKPEPSIGQIRGGVVIPKSPISMEKFSGLSIDDIAKNMRGEWDPANLAAKNTPDDFLSPLNAEGVGEMLRKDIGKRLPDYVKKQICFMNEMC